MVTEYDVEATSNHINFGAAINLPSLDIFNPLHEDYGAVGDNSTDDATAIQAAIDAAEAAGGGIVLLASHTFLIGTKLTVDSDKVWLVGVGAAKLRSTSAITDLVHFDTVDRCGILGLHLDGTGAVTQSCVLVDTCTNFLIRDCEIQDAASDTGAQGVRIEGSTRVTVQDNLIHTIRRGIVALAANCARVRIEGNEVRNYNSMGIELRGQDGVTHSDCWVVNNHIHSHNAAGDFRVPMRAEGDATNTVYSTRIHFRGNVVVGNGNSANDPTTPGTADQIQMKLVRDFQIIGNSSLDGGDYGINVSNDCQRGLVVGNCACGNDTAGISIGTGAATAMENISVVGNTTMNNGQNGNSDRGAASRSGIRIQDATAGIIVEGNVCGDDQGTATQQYGISLTNVTARVGLNVFDSNAAGDINYEGAFGSIDVLPLRSMGFFAHGDPAAGGTVYGSAAAGNNATEAEVSIRAPFAGRARNLYVDQPTTGPGSGETMTVTLRINGVDSALAVALSGTTTDGEDASDRPSFAAGDDLSISFVASNNGSYSGTPVKAACELIRVDT